MTILSYIFKERNEHVLIHAERYLKHHRKLTFTSLSASELLFGLYVKDARGQITPAKNLLKAHDELVPTSADNWLVAEINAALRHAGSPIGDADPIIAGSAINRGYPIANGNIKCYLSVVNAGFALDLPNWREP